MKAVLIFVGIASMSAQDVLHERNPFEFVFDRGDFQVRLSACLQDVPILDRNGAALRILPLRELVRQVHQIPAAFCFCEREYV